VLHTYPEIRIRYCPAHWPMINREAPVELLLVRQQIGKLHVPEAQKTEKLESLAANLLRRRDSWRRALREAGLSPRGDSGTEPASRNRYAYKSIMLSNSQRHGSGFRFDFRPYGNSQAAWKVSLVISGGSHKLGCGTQYFSLQISICFFLHTTHKTELAVAETNEGKLAMLDRKQPFRSDSSSALPRKVPAE
jgi:hypothetical protein